MSNADLIEPPHEIICYALKVGDWFKERNITHWKLADCASRDALELADKRIAELEKEAQFNFEQYQDAGRLLCEANEKLDVAREACKDIRRAIERECYAAAYIIVSEALAQIGGDDARS